MEERVVGEKGIYYDGMMKLKIQFWPSKAKFSYMQVSQWLSPDTKHWLLTNVSLNKWLTFKFVISLNSCSKLLKIETILLLQVSFLGFQ